MKVNSGISSEVLKVGKKVHQWVKETNNFNQADQFTKSIVHQLQSCIPASDCFKSVQSRKERMWGNYHWVRCSSAYTSAWKSFLGHNLESDAHPILWQRVGDSILKALIDKSFPVIRQEAAVKSAPIISHQEMNALRYAAGYVPRALRKKLIKSAGTSAVVVPLGCTWWWGWKGTLTVKNG